MNEIFPPFSVMPSFINKECHLLRVTSHLGGMPFFIRRFTVANLPRAYNARGVGGRVAFHLTLAASVEPSFLWVSYAGSSSERGDSYPSKEVGSLFLIRIKLWLNPSAFIEMKKTRSFISILQFRCGKSATWRQVLERFSASTCHTVSLRILTAGMR